MMKNPGVLSVAAMLIVISATRGSAESSGRVVSHAVARAADSDPIEFEMMTWREVHRAIHDQGKTIALVYNGGTEQRGPQNVNGGHTLMARETVRAIARKLGNAIAAPVMPFSVNNTRAELPGTIGLSAATFSLVNEEVAEQMIKNGFRTVVLMGDHGGGQKELGALAAKLDALHAPDGARIYYCDEVYAKANSAFDDWLKANGYPASSHGGLPDTSEMLYLGGQRGWVRKDLIATAVGDPVLAPGQARDPSVRLIDNGITGDGRRASVALGKRLFDMKVDYAVKQIKRLMATSASGE